jgi:phospholipid/cholesterol/gamma-HCH transport system permease protein
MPLITIKSADPIQDMNNSLPAHKSFSFRTEIQPDGNKKIFFAGHLGLQEVEDFEKNLKMDLSQADSAHTSLDLKDLEFVDSAGALALLELAESLKAQGGSCSLDNVPAKAQKILDLIDLEALKRQPILGAEKKGSFISEIGEGFLSFVRDVDSVVAFFGELIIDLVATCFNPRLVRWSDVILYMRRTGVEGLPIISLIALLLGLILAFMSSVQLQRFGANIYVASLLALAMVKELGPIMTAILVAGRSGSAFAAEIGTMKVNEEVDALIVMGMDPMYFLTLPKVIATLIVVPLLTIYADLIGIIGGLIVGVGLLDLTVFSYIQETKNILKVFDFVASFIKTLFFAFLISAIGCQRGFQVRGGAAAVGTATTSAVVAAIFLIIVVDSVFAVVLTYIPR